MSTTLYSFGHVSPGPDGRSFIVDVHEPTSFQCLSVELKTWKLVGSLRYEIDTDA